MFDSEVAELEFLLKHPFAGGAPDGDKGDGASEKEDQGGAGEGQGAEGKRESGDTGRPPDASGAWIPKHRFDEVNMGYNAYKGFGKPEEVKVRLARLAELEALPQNRINDKEKSEIRKELLHVFPELQVMTNMLEVQRQSYTERGATLNNDFLKDIGIEVNDANNQYLQELLSGIIAADQKLLRRFYAMDNKVFEDAFAVAKKTFWPNAKKPLPGAGLQGKKVLPTTPLKQKDGSDKSKEKGDETLDRMGERDVLDKASEKAFEMLEASRTE